jgi:hypothetical protein
MCELHGESLKGDQKWNSPDLAHQSDEETLIEFLGGPGPELELYDKQYAGGDDEEVGVEGRESESSESQGQVVCWWCLVCKLAEEVVNIERIKYHRDCPCQADEVNWPPVFS